MSITLKKVLVAAVVLPAVIGLMAACGDEGEEVEERAAPVAEEQAPPAEAAQEGATVVKVIMFESEEEWGYKLDKTEVPAGEVTFQVVNEGKFEHELMVYPPQREMAHILEEMKEAAMMGMGGHAEEIEGLVISVDGKDELELEPGESGTFTVNLAPGTYELGCLIVETVGGETFTHHEKGMHATLTVQ